MKIEVILSISFVSLLFLNSIAFAAVFGNLSVSLDWPTSSLSVSQNYNFQINATAECTGDDPDAVCGNVLGTARYNSTSLVPDTPISTTDGNMPLFTLTGNSLSCGSMVYGDTCNLSWDVNATGDAESSFLIDVLFSSDEAEVPNNDTADANVNIMGCFVDVTVGFDYIIFSDDSHYVWPNSNGNPALGNAGDSYGIQVNPGSCDVDFYAKATDMENQTLSSSIGVSNLSFSSQANDYQSSERFTNEYQMLKSAVSSGAAFTSWFWIDLPSLYAGSYNGTIYVASVISGQSVL